MLQIIEATENERKKFIDVYNEIFVNSEYYFIKMDETDVDFGTFAYYFVKEKKEPIGVLVLRKKPKYSPSDGVLSELGILKKYRNKGYGSEVLKFAETKLREMGYRTILAEILPIDHLAMFFAENGFVFSGIKYQIKLKNGKTKLVDRTEMLKLFDEKQADKLEVWIYLKKQL